MTSLQIGLLALAVTLMGFAAAWVRAGDEWRQKVSRRTLYVRIVILAGIVAVGLLLAPAVKLRGAIRWTLVAVAVSVILALPAIDRRR